MRIGELSDRTGVPVPTIKYYVREGLLPGGERLNRTQVSYGDEHVRRLRLVRALIEIGSLPIATVREVLVQVDRPGQDLDRQLGAVSRALAQVRQSGEAPSLEGVDEAMAIAGRQGWKHIDPRNDHIRSLSEVLATLRVLGLERLIDRVDDYARAAEIVAATDIELLQGLDDRDEVLEAMIIGTVLGDALFAALRRTAHVELSARHFKAPESTD